MIKFWTQHINFVWDFAKKEFLQKFVLHVRTATCWALCLADFPGELQFSKPRSVSVSDRKDIEDWSLLSSDGDIYNYTFCFASD